MSIPTIGARIKAARKELGITQQQLATKLGMNGASSISNWETGDIEPGAKYTEKLEKILFSKIAKRKEETKAAPVQNPPAEVKTNGNGLAKTNGPVEVTWTLDGLRGASFVKVALSIGADRAVKEQVLALLHGAKNMALSIEEIIEMFE